MTLQHTDETRDIMREEPFGEVPEAELEDVMGVHLPPAVIPEDNLRPGAKFVFGQEVADVFEKEVIPRQVPGYNQMRLRTVHIGREFVTPGSSVLDLGTSRGRTIRDLIKSFAMPNERYAKPDLIENVTYIGVDNEQPMLDLARVDVNALFDKLGATEEDAERIVKLFEYDLRTGIPDPINLQGGYSLITSVLTLQFVPIEYRQLIIQDIYDKLSEGGAFLWIEKVLGKSHKTDKLLTEVYHDDKRRNGISESAIVKKRESIQGFLVPQTSAANQTMLEAAGFRSGNIDIFWRDLQFEAYIAIK